MQFVTQKREILTNASISKKEMTLSANAKAFKIILGGIYPDIIKAIVRELFTNAWDSQKGAGTLDTPISIHSPSKYEPYFAIRDYGVGMSPDLVDKIYSNIFESTKDKSNDEAGTFGMGSKTPLGYMDNFTLISYQNGMFWYYDLYINEKGIPVVDLKDTGSTDEANGVYVQIAVKSEDINAFKNNILHFVFGANTPVTIDGSKYDGQYRTAFQTEKYEIVESPTIQVPYIRMGCVLYKLDFALLLNSYGSYQRYSGSNKEQRMYNMHNVPLILNFPIGEFEVTGSREDIIYNADSKQKIRQSLENVIDEVTKEIQEKIDASPNYFEAKRDFSSLFNDLAQKIYGSYNSHQYFKYKGKPLNDELYNFNSDSVNIGAISAVKNHYRSKVVDFSDVTTFSTLVNAHHHRKPIILHVPQDSKLTDKMISSRARFLKTVKDNSRHFKTAHFVYRGSLENKTFKQIVQDFGSLAILDFEKSVIPPPKEKEPRGSKTEKVYFCATYNKNAQTVTGETKLFYHSEDQFNAKEYSKYYVPIKRLEVEDEDYKKYSDVERILEYYEKYVDKDKKIAIINKSCAETAVKFKLKNIFDDFRDRLSKIQLNDDEIKKLAHQKNSGGTLNNFFEYSPELKKYLSVTYNETKIRPEVMGILWLSQKNYENEIQVYLKEVQEKTKKVLDALPLLEFMTYRYMNEDQTKRFREILSKTIKEIK